MLQFNGHDFIQTCLLAREYSVEIRGMAQENQSHTFQGQFHDYAVERLHDTIPARLWSQGMNRA